MSGDEERSNVAAIRSIFENQDCLISKRIKGVKHDPTDEERAAKIAELKAEISTILISYTGFDSENLENLKAFLKRCEIVSSNFQSTLEQEKQLKERLQEQRERNALFYTIDTQKEDSSDEDDDDDEKAAMSQRPPKFEMPDYSTIEALLPPVTHEVLQAMAEKNKLRHIHDNIIELKQLVHGIALVEAELHEETKKQVTFTQSLAQTIGEFNDPFMNEERKIARDHQLLKLILDENERLRLEVSEEIQYGTYS